MWVTRDCTVASEILRPAQGKQDGKERRAKKRKTTNGRGIVRKYKGQQRPIEEIKAFLNWFTASPITSNPCTLSTQAHVSLQNLSLLQWPDLFHQLSSSNLAYCSTQPKVVHQPPKQLHMQRSHQTLQPQAMLPCAAHHSTQPSHIQKPKAPKPGR